MKPSFVTIYRSGGQYKPRHVQLLKAMVDSNTTIPYEFVCYSDEQVDGVRCEPLWYGYPGWWSCVEIWRHPGPVVATGLDTVIVGNLDRYFGAAMNLPEDTFMLPSSPYKKSVGKENIFINGVQIWNGDWGWLLYNFDYERDSKTFRGDENYLLDQLFKAGIEIRSIQQEIGGVYSYSLEAVNEKPVIDPAIYYFHGKSKPWKTSLWRQLVQRYA